MTASFSLDFPFKICYALFENRKAPPSKTRFQRKGFLMPNYKIIATDLDGTLLNSESKISTENLAAIRKMTEMGIYFVPSTGRTLTEVPDEVLSIPELRYLIYSDGAGIYDFKAQKAIIQNGIRGKNKERALRIFRRYDTVMMAHYDGVSYVDAAKHDRAIYDTFRVTKGFQDLMCAKNRPMDTFDAFCDGLDEIELLCGFFKRDDEREACYAELLAANEYHAASSAPHNIEIVAKEAGKGNALLQLASLLGVCPEETVAVGDSTNDMENLKKAGLALAMGNAAEALKAIAHRVICNNDEHAMAYILDHIIR